MTRKLIAIVGLLLAAAGTTEAVDAIVPWVFGIVDSMSWVDVWRPAYNPEPMNTYTYRPLTVVILKFALLVTGRTVVAITFLHALVLVAFGLSAHSFLTRHGFTDKVAGAACLSAMVMPSLLFSAWICVEFDVVGAVFVLMAASALRDYEDAPNRGRWRRFLVLAALAVTIKETSALALLAYIGAFTWLRRTDRRWWRLAGGYLLALIICTLPMHFVPSTDHAFGVWSDGFHPMRIAGMLLHTSAQLIFLVSAAGLVLLASAAAAKRGLLVAGILTVVAIAAAPILRHYSHFEAVIFSNGPWTVASILILVAVMAAFLRPTSPHSRLEKTAVLMVVFTWAGYAVAPVVLSFARAAVSARIFAGCVPLLHAFAWREVTRLWTRQKPLAVTLGSLFFLFAASAAFNTISFYRTRVAVESEAKLALVKDLRMACPAFIETNPVQTSTIEELRAMGGERLNPDCVFVQNVTGNPDPALDVDGFAQAGGFTADIGQDVYLFIQTARSHMSAETNALLAGDFSWTAQLLPESDDDLFAAYQRMIYEIETDIETLFRRQGRSVADVSAPLYQLPLWWNEVPHRLLRGVPILERYDYVARVYRVPARKPGFVPEGGRARTDHR